MFSKIAQLQSILDERGGAGWKEVGRVLEDEAVLDSFLGVNARLMFGGMPYCISEIVTLNNSFADGAVVKVSNGKYIPGIYYGMTNGYGKKSYADHAAFYRSEGLVARLVTFKERDNGHDLFSGDGKALVRDSSWLSMISPTPLNPYLSEDHRFGIFALPEPALTIQEASLFLVGQASYYHFMIDHLPILLIAQEFPEISGLPVIMHRFLQTQIELCNCFGADHSRVVALERYCDRSLFAVTLKDPVVPAKLPLPLSVTILRQNLYPSVPHNPGKRRIFLGRRESPDVAVRLSNQDEIVETLTNLGFETVFSEDLRVEEQRALFSEAAIIVATHGAGLTNIVFSSARTVVVELMSAVCDGDGNGIFECYRKIAAIIGQPYYRLVCPTLPVSGFIAPQDVPFRCNPQHLCALLSAVVREV